MGHGGRTLLTDEGMVVLADVAELGNGGRLPVVSAMSCIISRFTRPAAVSLGEALTLHESGGAIAVWAPTGESLNFDAMTLNGLLFEELFEGSATHLGDVILNTLTRAETIMWAEEEYMLRIYNILGDPSVEIW